MHKIVTKLMLALSAIFLLSACSDKQTNRGGESSITNKVETYQYTIPDSIKTQIEQQTEKIIITEIVSTSSFAEYDDIFTDVASYIHSINDAMVQNGYTIISSDSNGLGEYSTTVSVTLIFENTKN